MKRLFLLLGFLTTLTLVNAQKNVKTLPVDSVLKLTTEVIKEIGKSGHLPGAKNISLSFETEASTSTNAGLKILIFSFGRKWSKAKTSSVTYEFSLNQNLPYAESQKFDIKKALTIAIRNAYEEASKIRNPHATLESFTVSVSFTIEKGTDGSGEYVLVPITPSLGRSWSKRATHTISVEFSKNR